MSCQANKNLTLTPYWAQGYSLRLGGSECMVSSFFIAKLAHIAFWSLFLIVTKLWCQKMKSSYFLTLSFAKKSNDWSFFFLIGKAWIQFLKSKNKLKTDSKWTSSEEFCAKFKVFMSLKELTSVQQCKACRSMIFS